MRFRSACTIVALSATAACSDAVPATVEAPRDASAPATSTSTTTTAAANVVVTTTTSPAAIMSEMAPAPKSVAVVPRATAGSPNAPPGTSAPAAPAATAAPPRPANGAPQSFGRCALFPRTNYWYANVSTLPVHPQSAAYVASIGATSGLKADFGSGLWNGGPIGIPYVVVPAGQAKVPMSFEYADESDPGPYPIPPDAPVEGGPQSDGDRHVIVVDQTDCTLYETFAARPAANGWTAGSGAAFDLASNALRPAGWTSADAAGLPILPGLVRYEEVASGRIDHAIRITVPRTQRAYVWPARHFASSRTDVNLPPMGLWLRLRADFDASGFPREAQVILEALKRHGAIVADNGSPWYLTGAPDERWNNDALATLRRVPGSAFEAVDTTSLPVSANSGQVR